MPAPTRNDRSTTKRSSASSGGSGSGRRTTGTRRAEDRTTGGRKAEARSTTDTPAKGRSTKSGSTKGKSAKGRSTKGSGGRTGTATVAGPSAAEAAAAAEQDGATVKMSADRLRSAATPRVVRVGGSDAGTGARLGRRFAGLGSGVPLIGRLGGGRVGGVAPFVPPRSRLGRRLRMREWSRVGFVQLSPGKQKLRHRILPRTVIGISGLLMAAGIGAAFSGAAFYAYYDDRLAENERTVARFVEGFDQQFTDASGALDEIRTEAVDTIRTELAPLESYVADAQGVVGLPATAGPSVWLVETRGEDGSVRHGSAFAVVGHEGGTALVTSHEVVQAATTNPAPAIELIKDGRRIPATLWSWDAQRDLALLVVGDQIPTLDLADPSTRVRAVGGRVFAMSGFGGQGATASPGLLLDQSQIGLQHTAPVGTLFVGGPLLDAEGRVLGVAAQAYRPLGIEPGQVAHAPDVTVICESILRCSEQDGGTVDIEVVEG
ncbi:MAG: serine protease [Actinomycetota bacterium]